MSELDDILAAQVAAKAPAAKGSDAPLDLDAILKAQVATSPSAQAPAEAQQRSFLGEATHRVADAGHGFAENVRNIRSTSPGRIWENAKTLANPFVEAGRGIADEVANPVRTFQGSPLARWTGLSTPEAEARHDAIGREMVRGVQSNVPLAGLAHERLTGFPEASADDEALAPHAAGVGQVAGMAAFSLAPKAAPLVGRVVGNAANATQDALAAASEASLARSAARYASSPAPIRTAIKDFAEDVSKHSFRHGGLAMAGHMIGGETGALIGTGLSLAKPAWRAAVTTADEALAKIARSVSETKLLPEMTPEVAAPVVPSPVEAAAAENAAHIERIRNADGAIEMGPVENAVAKAVDPKIALLEDGLKEATPAQAKAIKAAIEGIKLRAERIASKPALEPEKIAPSLEERAAATRIGMDPAMPPAQVAAPFAQAVPTIDPDLAERAIAASRRRGSQGGLGAIGAPGPQALAIQPSAATLPIEFPSPTRPSNWRPLDSTGSAPVPSLRRSIESTGFNRVMDSVARDLQNSATSQDFVRKAVKRGMDAREARKLWRAARPYAPK